MEEPKIHILTYAYNAERTIRRTIESVLSQTYPNFTYVLQDNGSTDGTFALCREYAERDPRIKLVRNRKNFKYESEEDREALKANCGVRFGTALDENDFACFLDADDEYLPDFFERAVRYGLETRADIVVGGTETVQEGTGQKLGGVMRPQPLLLAGNGFSDAFPQYHWHLRQVWGKLYRRHTLLGYLEYFQEFMERTLGSRGAQMLYGGDTLHALYAFRHADRVGILSGCSHRYYIQEKSTSTSLPANRVASDAILHNATVDFLVKKCGHVSPQNRAFLQVVYSNAVSDTVRVIQNAALSPAERLREYRRIAESPITLAAYRECRDESAARSKASLLQAALEAGVAQNGEDSEDFRTTVQPLLPLCGRAVTGENAALFFETRALLEALLRDDPDAVLKDLLARVEQGRGVKKYGLTKMIQALAADNPLLCQIDDAVFLKQYGELYWKVWQGNLLPALDEMTGSLMENQVRSSRETFLELYLSLAASLEQPAAFVFGKLRLAELYLGQNRTAESRGIVKDLEEMGLGKDDEVRALRAKLEEDAPRA